MRDLFGVFLNKSRILPIKTIDFINLIKYNKAVQNGNILRVHQDYCHSKAVLICKFAQDSFVVEDCQKYLYSFFELRVCSS